MFSFKKTLRKSDWEAQATGLRVGESKRVTHNDEETPALSIKRHHNGYSAYCYRCNCGGFIREQEDPSEKLKRIIEKKEADRELSGRVTLPDGLEYNPQKWPNFARVWLYKAGINNDVIKRNKLGYDEKTKRVIIPVYSNGEIVYFQARGFFGGPKYINPKIKKNFVAEYGKRGSLCIIVEDLLSAIKMGQWNYSISIMGTSLNPSIITHLLSTEVTDVVLMLDPDNAGENGTEKYERVLESAGIEYHTPKLERDPKYLTRGEVCGILSDIRRNN